jgi:copper chaperone
MYPVGVSLLRDTTREYQAERRGVVTSTEYTVRGMTCGHCASAVTEEVTKIPGVAGVEVDVASGRVTVQSSGPVSDEAVSEAVEEAGYEVVTA